MNIDELFAVRGKTALVTGGSRGIGLMVARALVANGVRVYVSSRSAEACTAAAKELGSVGEAFPLPADLSGEPGAASLAEELADREERLHILINNAGATWGAALEDYPDAAFDKLWGVNVKAPFHLVRLLLPQLRAAATASDPARVVNVGSVNGLAVPPMPRPFPPPGSPSPENYAYTASKAALHMLTRHLAHRLASENVTVNAVAPGPFETKMMSHVLSHEAGRAAMASMVPLGRIGEPEDIAGAVLFLTSRAGAYLTGTVLPVDGGYSTHG